MHRLLLGGCLAAVVVGVPMALLATADLIESVPLYRSPIDRVRWTIDHGDHLHFAIHLLGGRLLDLTPWTRDAALDQYERAQEHAQTRRQTNAVTLVRPRSPYEWSEYITAPLSVGLQWAMEGVAWLGGDRSSDRAVVVVEMGRCTPAVVHVKRGAAVIWRNSDGATQTVSFPGARYGPQEVAAGGVVRAVFPIRGRYRFACGTETDTAPLTRGEVVVT